MEYTIPVVPEKRDKLSFEFSPSFKKVFTSGVDTLRNVAEEASSLTGTLNKHNIQYGICNCSYKLRYITSTNIADFVNDFEKAMRCGFIHGSITDAEMFAVAYAQKCIADNGCVSFTDSSIMGNGYELNLKTATLRDLIMVCENDVFSLNVYSKYELVERIKSVDKDLDKITQDHFVANITKIVDKIPSILKESAKDVGHNPIWNNVICKEAFVGIIEEFILFALTLNAINLRGIIDYCIPKTTYNVDSTTVVQDDKNAVLDTEEAINKVRNGEPVQESVNVSRDVTAYITECCMLKTNDIVLRSKLPFDINMKNIVLQDTHPKFKDTLSALRFVLHDTRSPIKILGKKYCTLDPKDHGNGYMVAKMLIRTKHYPHGVPSVDDTLNYYDFHTDVNWLDKIAYGNNYLDCNYRNDTNGNHHMHPVRNTLDAIYKLFDCCDITDNEGLANNIADVGSTMESLIHMYGNNEFDNHELVRDVLATLGEILTRSMLKLYYNNTLVFVASDQMDDTMIPGYMYMESVVIMEADNDATKNVVDNTKAKIEVQNGNNLSKSQQITGAIDKIVQRFIEWINNKLSTYSQIFNKNHQNEINWVTKNEALNNEIKTALSNNTFSVKVTNMPNYNVPQAVITKDLDLDAEIKKFLDNSSISEETLKSNLYPEVIRGDIDGCHGDAAKEAAVVTKWVLYGRTNPGASGPGPGNGNIDGNLTQQHWDNILDNILNTTKALEQDTKAFSDQLKKASQNLLSQINQNKQNLGELSENASDDEKKNHQEAQDRQNRLQTAYNVLKSVSTNYCLTTINVMNKHVYSKSYNFYRDVVRAYQQQKASSQNNSNNTQQNGQNTATTNGDSETLTAPNQ